MRINIKKRKNKAHLIISLFTAFVVVVVVAIAFNVTRKANVDSPQDTLPIVVSEEDKVLVENYIRKNIARLAPENPVLGGSWYVTEVNVNSTSRTGTFVYEDGHIQGVAEFRFTKNQSNLLSIGIRKKS